MVNISEKREFLKTPKKYQDYDRDLEFEEKVNSKSIKGDYVSWYIFSKTHFTTK